MILGLILTISACYVVELFLVHPYWPGGARGFLPSRLEGLEPWYLAVGILGATVMPHNLFLHSSLVQTRSVAEGRSGMHEALRLNTLDTVTSLSLSLLVNAAILVLAGAAFHAHGHREVTGIDEAYRLLEPVVGGSLASFAFGIALLAAGQSSTFTGTIAGQVVMEGFMQWKIPCWQRRLITRGLALVPAYLGVLWFGEHSVGRLLVLSQVVLSVQLPFAIFPLLLFVRDRRLMGEFRAGNFLAAVAWGTFAVILLANGLLLWQLV